MLLENTRSYLDLSQISVQYMRENLIENVLGKQVNVRAETRLIGLLLSFEGPPFDSILDESIVGHIMDTLALCYDASKSENDI